MRGAFDGKFGLGRIGEREKRVGGREDAGRDRGGDTVAGDIEEAGIAAGVPDAPRDGLPVSHFG